MDVYRIGTLLEMVREMAYALAEDGKLVKVCVQQSMGQGVFQVCLTLLHHAFGIRNEKAHWQHSTAQHSTAQHSTAQRSAAQRSAAQHSTAQPQIC